MVGRRRKINHQFRFLRGKRTAGFAVGLPRVFADLNADFGAEGVKGERFATSVENALFVEDAIVRQKHFAVDADDLAFMKNNGGVIAAGAVGERRADHGKNLSRQFVRQPLDLFVAVLNELRAQNEIFRRIAAERQFRKNNQLRAVSGRAFGGGDDAVRIFLERPDGRVHLNERCLQSVHYRR